MKLNELIDKLEDAVVYGPTTPAGGTIFTEASVEHVCNAIRILRNLPVPEAMPHDAPPPYDDPDGTTCPKVAWAAGWNACAEHIKLECDK